MATVDPERQERLDEYENMIKKVQISQDRFQGLKYLYDNNSNFTHIDQTTNNLGVADTKLLIANIKRHMALEYPQEGKGSTIRTKLFEESSNYIKLAEDVYTKAKDAVGVAQCKRLYGIILQSFMYKSPNGKYQLRKNVALTSQIREHWTKALDAFIKADEVERTAEMKERLVNLDEENALFAAILKLMDQDHTDEDVKEKAKIKAVFRKYDKDNSGTIDMVEFHAFAADLYTYPPLREKELSEVLVQMGYDPEVTDCVEWKNFWFWWCSGEILMRQHAAEDVKDE